MTESPLRWVTSSYSENGGQCIEWAPDHALRTGEVQVRDSKKPGGPVLSLTPQAFAGLVQFAKERG